MATLLPLHSHITYSHKFTLPQRPSPRPRPNPRPANVFPNRKTKGQTRARPPRAEAEERVGGIGKAAIVGGVVANPVVVWSLYTLKTTGCGLPPGPGGALGALEGISFLTVFGLIAWSLYTKVKTGSGLPSGPYGLLGAVEGLSYLSFVATVAVFGLQYFDAGFVPGPLPSDKCFG